MCGENRGWRKRGRGIWDHPRVCGENKSIVTFVQVCKGSPPRVRGKQIKFFDGDSRDRITPACAGKTVSYIAFKTQTKDHPRVCGENMLSVKLGE